MVTRLCLWLTLRLRRCWRAMVALGLCLAVSLTVITPAASQGPLGQPIGGGLPPTAPRRVKQVPRPASTVVPVPNDQSHAPDQEGLGDPIGGMSEQLRVANPFVKGRYPTFGMGNDSYGIEMSLWPEDMEIADGQLQWRVNVVRFSPAVSSNYRTPLRPDGYITGVGAITATMSLTQNGTCISVLSIGERAMAKIEVDCSRGPGLMFRVLKPPRQTRWIVVNAVYRETEGLPTVVQEYLADMWTGKVWQVADFRSEGFTIEPCSGEARTLWNSASAQRLGLRVEDCLNTVLWPSDENRLGGQKVIAAREQESAAKPAPAPDETAAWLASYRDNFLGGEVRVTTIAQARVRSYPTSDGSTVVQTLPPDTAISGRWVSGRDPTTRWLRRAGTGDYVWEGNLKTGASEPPAEQSMAKEDRSKGFMRFPLDCVNSSCTERYRDGAYSAGKINSVLDHSMRRNQNGNLPYGLPSGDGKDEIVAYDGERASGLIFDVNCLGGSIKLPNSNNKAMTNAAGCKDQPGYAAYDDHPGYDYQAALGTPVMAAAAGRVLNLSGQRCYIGNMGSDCARWGFVGIDHGNGYVSQYGHLSRVLVGPGDDIIEGQLIGYSGATAPKKTAIGPHLHFEVWKVVDGKYWLVDPYGWTGSGADPLYSANRVPPAVLWDR